MTTDINFYRMLRSVTDVANEIKEDPDALSEIETKSLHKFAENLRVLAIAVHRLADARVALEEAKSRVNHPTSKGEE